jgi:hypothetical protein
MPKPGSEFNNDIFFFLKMKPVVHIVFSFFLNIFCFCQVPDTSALIFQPVNLKTPKPEILTGGFIDIIQNGQMNASARLFRLFIGEPGKFQIPVSLYTGVSANNLSYNRQNDEFILNLISPGSGIFNLSFDGNNTILGKKQKFTSLQIQYQAGFRFLSFFNKNIQRNTNFFNSINTLGLTFITGAWERNKPGNMGIFWLNIRGLFSGNPEMALNEILGQPVSGKLFGYSAGFGLEISQALNVKIFYFRFLNNRDIAAFTPSFLQLTFNYSIK